MRVAFRDRPSSNSRDGVWFAAALALGAVWGFSVEPVHLPAAAVPGLAQLKLLGWLIVAVLCLVTGAVGWLILRNPLEATGRDESGRPPQDPPAMSANPFRSAAGNGNMAEALHPFPQADPEPCVEPAQTSPQNAPPPMAPSALAEARDSFLAALEFLGHAQATVRIGGILALERSARQGGDLRACTGTLGAYVQQWAGAESPSGRSRPGFDVTAALAVLSRLLPSGDPLRNLADLRRAHLAGLELTDADLSRFHLEHADLSGADLRGANLSGVNFRGANLRGALLSGAVFAGSSLRGADLTGAVLSDDEFGPADLSQAGNLSAAQLQHIRYHPVSPPRLPPGRQLGMADMAEAV